MNEKLQELVEQFKYNINQYKSYAYDEANTRIEFIDKFFKLLGWDLDNNKGYSESYKDVVREDKVRIGGKQKAPDYSFRIGGRRKFFVEAKKPSVNIKDNIDSAYQIRRYGYSAKLPLSILTDFEEFAIYDTRIKPNKNDNASVARVFYCTYDKYEKPYKDYESHFEFIYNTFSFDAINKGSFDKYAEKNKKGTSEVDKELLKVIENWRLDLAKNIALRNNEIDIYNLNDAVQKIIDRIIFLRIAEDKGIEDNENLFSIIKLDNVYKELNKLFINANDKYNAGLFSIENWLSDIKIDNVVLSKIINELYPPNCPYEFSVMPIEILGNIYEQFLGKTIKFRNVRGGHTAIIEEKLEVRKAGGVYYTPQYIVDYIVKSTIGEKIKNKKPKEISKIKICDPACGSGSFLVGAYQFLLNYHLDYYTKIENLSKSLKNNKIYQISENDYRLPIEEKQRILVNNIYGVDIDLQAVEVTKLSLYLKLLENESKESEGYLFKHTDLKLLPKLDKNIKCGNSLINSDFYSNKDLSLFGNEEMRKINVFDWDKEFKEIFEDKGFDIVIGNPPYVSVELMSTEDKQYYKKFDTFIKRGDLFSLFLDHASATISKGYVSFIVPSIVLNNLSYKKLRERFLRNKILKEVCYTGGKIFDGVTVDTVILIIDLDKVNEIKLINALDFDEHIIHTVEIGYFEKYNNNISVSNLDSSKICDKIFIEDFDTVENHFTVFQGIVTGNNEAFIFENEKEALDKGIEKELLKPLCHGRDIEKWVVKNLDRRIMYINSSININKFPGAHNWLKQHKTKLETRRECKNGAIPWYSLQWARNVNELNIIPKIAIQNTRNERLKTRIIAALDEKSFYSSQGINFIIPKSNEISILFLLGILNSKLINYLFQTKFLNLAIKAEYLKKLKIPNNNQEELEKIVSLMIETQKQYHSSQSVNDKKIYKQKIDMIDNQIDQMVYKLYALTDEEIKIVEEN